MYCHAFLLNDFIIQTQKFKLIKTLDMDQQFQFILKFVNNTTNKEKLEKNGNLIIKILKNLKIVKKRILIQLVPWFEETKFDLSPPNRRDLKFAKQIARISPARQRRIKSNRTLNNFRKHYDASFGLEEEKT
jgi:uncharacterized protein YecE (DUF72 family)